MVKWTNFIEVADLPDDVELNTTEIPSVDHVYIAPGYKLYNIVSDFSHTIAPITVPFKRETTFRDIKNEVARALSIEQPRQDIYYAGVPMGDDWSVCDLPIDCNTFHVRVLPKKVADMEWISEVDKLIDGEELPARIRHQMELERLGRWNLSAGMRENATEESREASNDAVMASAFIESEYAILHERIIMQLNARWAEYRILAQKDACKRKMMICEDEKTVLESLVTKNASARQDLCTASHGIQEELNTDQEAYAANAKLATEAKDEFDGVDLSQITVEEEKKLRDQKLARLQGEITAKRHVRHFQSDMWTFCYFVILFTIVVFSAKGNPQNSYYFYRSIQQGLEGALFQQVTDQETMWRYITDEYVPQVARIARSNGATISPYDAGYYQDFNRVAGAIRIRQIRGDWQECEQLPDGLQLYPCFNSNEYKAPLHKLTHRHTIPTPEPMQSYNYTSDSGTQDFSGELDSYPGSGFIVDLDATYPSEALQKAQAWTDHLTRALFLEVNMFNANLNSWASVRVLFEMPLTGGVRPNVYYGVVKFFRYANDQDYYVLAFECLFLALMIYYGFGQVKKIRMYGFKVYILSFWTCYDLVNFGVLFAVVGMRGYSMITLMDLDLVNVPSSEFINLYDLSQVVRQEANVNCVNSIMMYLRAFKFFILSPRMKQFIDTWDKASMNLIAFWTMMMIILVSYAAAGYVLFGTKLSNFKTFGECILTIIQYMVASYDLDEMEAKVGFVGTFFILCFIMMIYFVLMNIPMIVLAEAYEFQMNLISAGVKADLPSKDLYYKLENTIPCIKTARLKREEEEEHELRIQAGIIVDEHRTVEMMLLIQKVTEKIGSEAVSFLIDEHFSEDFDFEGEILTEDWRKMCLLMKGQNANMLEKFRNLEN